jgi:hypothetical protein
MARYWRQDENREHWNEAQRRGYYRDFNRRAHAQCIRGDTSGSCFQCQDERCPCGGTVVVYWRKPENAETFRPEANLYDANGPHFASYPIVSGVRRRHTQSDLRHARAEILRRAAADEGIRPVGTRGRRADLLRMIGEVLDRGTDRSKDCLRELVDAGFIDGTTYAVTKLLSSPKLGLSKTALHHAKLARTSELSARAPKPSPKRNSDTSTSTREPAKFRGVYIPSTKRSAQQAVAA